MSWLKKPRLTKFPINHTNIPI